MIYHCLEQIWKSGKDKLCRILLNGNEVFSDNFQMDPGKIVGVHFMFYGNGAVDDVILKDSAGKIYFEDNFNR